jgi:ParB/RepB/Spo0J family partition protein
MPIASDQRTYATIDELCLSPFNVRTNEEDATATDALERSIAKYGVIMPLVVHPMRGSKKMGVLAGGRRYRSIRKMLARPEWPADRVIPIPIVIRDLPEAELLEVSLTENMIRRDLRQYEISAAVTRASRKGETVDQIADALGQTTEWVKRKIRLGTLAKPIFDVYAAGEISEDQARAYAATEDEALQLLAFETLRKLPHGFRDAAAIRKQLAFNDQTSMRLLRLVGEGRYLAAGGAFELDLFADGEDRRLRIEDQALLRRLADEALASTREDVRRRVGRDIRFAPEPPKCEYGVDNTLRIYPRPEKGGVIPLPEGDVVATITVPESGDPEVAYWWASRRAKHGSTKAERTSAPRSIGAAIDDRSAPGATQATNAEIKIEIGIGADTVEIFRSLRRWIMRAVLVRDARAGRDVGTDFLVWSQARQLFCFDRYDWRAGAIGASVLQGASADPQIAAGFVDATPAKPEVDAALRTLRELPAFADPDHAFAFRAYRREDASTKRLVAALVAGIALERSLNFEGYRLPVHDALMAECYAANDRSVRALWNPTAALLGRIPTEQRLALAEPFVEPLTTVAWSKRKSAEITDLVMKVLTGSSSSIRTKLKEVAARQWVHPLLSFTAQPPAGAAEPAEAHEDLLLRKAAE